MQVYSNKLLSDKESVNLGTKKIFNAYLKFKENYNQSPDKYYGDWSAIDEMILDYNGGSSYRTEVYNLANDIIEKFYKNTSDILVPKKG